MQYIMDLLKTNPNQSKKNILICLLLTAACFAVFWQVTSFEFVNFDDPIYIIDNTNIQHGLNGDAVKWAFTSHLHGHFHPLTWITHTVDFMLYGMDPMGHHLSNLLLHIMGTLLLFLVLNRMTANPLASGFAAALFALHPLHVESVAWVSDRKDLLCGFFWISALWIYIRIAENRSILYHLLLLVVYALGLLSKSMMITLPLVLFVLDLWPLNRLKIFQDSQVQTSFPQALPIRIVLEKIGLFIIAGAFVLISTRAMQELHVEPKQLSPFWQYDFVLFVTHYLQKFLWPLNLTVLYPYAENPSQTLLVILGLMLTAITLAATLLYKKLPFLLTGWLWFIITLLPVLGLIHDGPHRVADRYTYIPLIGLIIMLVWSGKTIFTKLFGHKKTVPTFTAALLLLALSFLSFQQAARWQNSLSLFHHAVSIYPENWVAHNNLGDAYDTGGEKERAIQHYRTSLQIKPRYAKANYNLGNTLASLGRNDEALHHYQEAIKIYPEFAEAHNNSGVLLAQKKRYLQAKEFFATAVKLDPGYDEAVINLQDISGLVRELEEQIRTYEEQSAAAPDNADLHNNLGLLYREGGDTAKAQLHFQEALQIKPDYAGVHNNLGILLAEQGKLAQAKLHFQQAVKIDQQLEGARVNLERITRMLLKK